MKRVARAPVDSTAPPSPRGATRGRVAGMCIFGSVCACCIESWLAGADRRSEGAKVPRCAMTCQLHRPVARRVAPTSQCAQRRQCRGAWLRHRPGWGAALHEPRSVTLRVALLGFTAHTRD